MMSLLTIAFLLIAQSPMEKRHPASVEPRTISGYAGELVIARLGSGRLLFTSGRIGSGQGTIAGPQSQGPSYSITVPDGRRGVLACSIQGRFDYSLGSIGRLSCLRARDAISHPVETIFVPEETRFNRILALHTDGSEAHIIVQRGLGRQVFLAVNLDTGSVESSSEHTWGGSAGFITFIGPDYVGQIDRQRGQCRWRLRHFPVGDAALASEQEVVCPRSGGARLLHDRSTNQNYLLITGAGKTIISRIGPNGSLSEVARVSTSRLVLSSTQAAALHAGVLYYDAGRDGQRAVQRLGTYDIGSGALAVRELAEAHGFGAALLGFGLAEDTSSLEVYVVRVDHSVSVWDTVRVA